MIIVTGNPCSKTSLWMEYLSMSNEEILEIIKEKLNERNDNREMWGFPSDEVINAIDEYNESLNYDGLDFEIL